MAKSRFNAQKIKVNGHEGTPAGELNWLFISGDGKDQSEKKDGSKMQKQVTLHLHKDSAGAKALIAEIERVWGEWKEFNPAIKPATKAKSLGFKPVKDKDTDEETDVLAFTFSTNSFFPAKPGEEQKPSIIKVFDSKGSDVTAAFHESGKILGNGTYGKVFGSAGGYEYNGTFGVSLYLTGIQIGKPVWYEGATVETQEMEEGEDLGLTEAMPGVNL